MGYEYDDCRLFVDVCGDISDVREALVRTGRYAAIGQSLVHRGAFVDVRRNKSTPDGPDRAAVLAEYGEWFGWPVSVEIWRGEPGEVPDADMVTAAREVRDDLLALGARVMVMADFADEL
ncbi:hypothetical protein GCM10010124_05970 [Pilimelia terevasa]|uniref:Uncharacterized protein n=1 Tax=Pilimelia terevasa TaxID=53372 RepID=A0A8J3BNF0_9ACTN|nr:hypothetical protein [Pilimelia terevasa]GGK16157.1 hypothetical protein GCM10010124_05970 [Pilimelia terevasa]